MGERRTPKYQAIANRLRSRILDGELGAGVRLPAQQEMAAEFQVTLMTLRHALAALEAEGLITTTNGRGTFVADAPFIRLGMDYLGSFADDMHRHGMSLTTELVEVQFDQTSEHQASARAALDTDEPVVEIVRRRRVGSSPAVLQRSFLTKSVWPRVAPVDLSAVSLYDALAERTGHRVARATELFRAVTLTTHDQMLLGVERSQPCLESVRTSFDAGGTPFLYDRAVMLGSSVEVRVERAAHRMEFAYGGREVDPD